MCGSSSTTTTVPFSALTFLAFHLPHPELPECGDPSQNHHDWRTHPFTRAAHHDVHRHSTREPGREEHTCRTVRTHLIRLGAGALAAGRRTGHGRHRSAAPPATPGSTPATAAPSAVPATLAGIKAKAATDITDRVNALNGAIAKVNAAKGLGSGQGTLVSYLGADISPLQQLNQTIQGDTTVQQAAQDFATIFSDYRVYVLVLPPSRIAADADHATTTAIPALTADAAKAQAHVNPRNQAAAAAADRRPQQPDRHRDQRDQRPGRHGAGLHAGPVERQPRPAGRGEVVGRRRPTARCRRADPTCSRSCRT